MKNILENFYQSSTIHGVKYFSNIYHFIERIFWYLSLIIAVILTTLLIVELIAKIQHSPIVIYLSEQAVSISNLNFPAVTVCHGLTATLYRKHNLQLKTAKTGYFERHNMKKVFYTKGNLKEAIADEITIGTRATYIEILDMLQDNFIKLKNLGTRILKRLQVVDLISNRGYFQSKNFSIPTNDFLDVINEFNKEFYDKEYTGEPYNHYGFDWIGYDGPLISEILTENGLCFSFNIAASDDMLRNSTSSDFNYELFRLYETNKIIDEIIPRNTSTTMTALAVFAFFESKTDRKTISKLNRGDIMLIHDAFEMPTKSALTLPISSNQMIEIIIEPQVTTIDDSLIDFDPIDRNCYLPHERSLKYFKVYTKVNCEHECLSQFMADRCNCVEFFMIRNHSTRICSASEKNCFDRARDDFDEDYRSLCGCLRPCEHIKYNCEIRLKKENERGANYNDDVVSKIDFKYKSKSYNQFVRKLQFDKVDFLSFVGGLLGLFSGFSALSFIELIYWFLLKLFAKIIHIRMNRNRVMAIEVRDNVSENQNGIAAEYFESSSIHGFNYFVNSNYAEKIFWVISFIVSMTACSFLIIGFNEKLPNSRVIALDDTLDFNERFEFPAITFTPSFFVNYKLGITLDNEKYMERLYNKIIDDDKLRHEFYINLTQFAICTDSFDSEYFRYGIDFNDYILLVYRLSSRRDWFVNQSVIWNGRNQIQFSEIRTMKGMGFTFNILKANDLLDFNRLSTDFNYTQNVTMNNAFNDTISYPITLTKEDKFKFTLRFKDPMLSNFQFSECFNPSLLIHSNDFLPTFFTHDNFRSMKYGMALNVEIIPEIIKTDDDLKKVKPEIRECYFENEAKLKYFKKYSQKNCEIECYARYSFESCGCVERFQPSNQNIRLCTDISDNCGKYWIDSLERQGFSTITNCSCLPLCNSIDYHVNFIPEHYRGDEYLTINVMMNADDLILYRRYQQFTLSDAVSYIGGLLGLFAGISMLSIVEIFYFFIIRFGVNIWRTLNRN